MKRNNKHSNRVQLNQSSEELRRGSSKAEKYKRRKQRREDKNAIRALYNDMDNLIEYEY
jgi:hypothetical protein